jgi:hypothetical protein
MPASGLIEVLRPFLWLALAAFVAGFLSYAALGGARASAQTGSAFAPLISAPASEDWNLPKRI